MKHNLSAHFLWHIYGVMCSIAGALGQGREAWYVRGSCRKPLFRGAILHIMILMFAMWPYMKDDLSNDNKLNNETER